MNITKVVIQNFLGVSSCETRLDNRGLVLVTGENTTSESFDSNGSGKSTIFAESVCWGLFGETVRGKKGNDVINKVANKDCMVSLTIQEDDTTEYTIARYRKHKTHKNSVILTKDGLNITGKSDTETTNMICDIIGMDYLSFTNSIVFGDGLVKKFASATDSEKKAILEKMLQIDIFKKCMENSKGRLSKVLLSQKGIELQRESYTTLLRKYKSELSDLQMKEANLYNETTLKIDGYNKSIKDWSKRITQLNSEMKEVESTISELQGNIDTLLNHEKSMEEEIATYREKTFERKSLAKTLMEIDKELNDMEQEYRQLLSGKNIPSVCKACGQEIPKGDTSHMEKELGTRITSRLSEYDSVAESLESVNKYVEDNKDLSNSYEKIKTDIKNVTNTISDCKYSIKIKTLDKNNLSTAISQNTKLIQEQKDLQNTIYTDLIEELINNIDSTKTDISTLDSEMLELGKKAEELSFWVSAFGNSGIKSMMLDDVTPFLNRRANHYLGLLSDSSMTINIDTQSELKSGKKSEKFSVNIQNSNGDDSYVGSSGGEKKRIDISISLALQDLVQSRSNKRLNLLVIDEVFDALDETGCEGVIKLLNEKANDCGSIFVITHNEYLQGLFTNVTKIVKTENSTKIIDN